MRNGVSVAVAVEDAQPGGRGAAGGDRARGRGRVRATRPQRHRHRRHRGGDATWSGTPAGARCWSDARAPQGPGLELVCAGPGARHAATSRPAWPTATPAPGSHGRRLRRDAPAGATSSPSIRRRAAAPRWSAASGPGSRGRQRRGAGRSPGLAVPIAGETACGDGWTAVHGPGRGASWWRTGWATGPRPRRPSAHRDPDLSGAGHGAARSSCWTLLHAGMRSTRGAAVAVAAIDRDRARSASPASGTSARRSVTGDKVRHLVSHNGTVGHQMRKVQEFVYPWEPGGPLLVLHSDGLGVALEAGPVPRSPAGRIRPWSPRSSTAITPAGATTSASWSAASSGDEAA